LYGNLLGGLLAPSLFPICAAAVVAPAILPLIALPASSAACLAARCFFQMASFSAFERVAVGADGEGGAGESVASLSTDGGGIELLDGGACAVWVGGGGEAAYGL
jgi:hypothetical protein